MQHSKIKYFLLAVTAIFFLSCSDEATDLAKPNLSPLSPMDQGLVSLVLTTDSITADGLSTAEFILWADTAISKYYKDVVFTVTTPGLFSNGTASFTTTLDASGKAKVYVHSSSSGIVEVKADLTNLTSRTSSVYFRPSWADQILILPDSATMISFFSNSTSIKAKLIRNTGSVSSGMLVNFSDSTVTTGSSVGTFLGITTSNSTGEATAIYAIQDTSYHGFVYIKGSVMTNSGVKIGRNKILIQ